MRGGGGTLHPKATNPDNQYGSLIFWSVTSGLGTGFTSGKEAFNFFLFFSFNKWKKKKQVSLHGSNILKYIGRMKPAPLFLVFISINPPGPLGIFNFFSGLRPATEKLKMKIFIPPTFTHPPPLPPHSVICSHPPPLRGGRIAPAEQPSCTRCVQPPPPRCARGGYPPPPTFPPPPPPTANCWQWWGVGRGGWGVRCRVEQKFFFII
nr:hypothetical protein [Morchella crassipes]